MECGSEVIGPCNGFVGQSTSCCVVKWGQKCQTLRDYPNEDLVDADEGMQATYCLWCGTGS